MTGAAYGRAAGVALMVEGGATHAEFEDSCGAATSGRSNGNSIGSPVRRLLMLILETVFPGVALADAPRLDCLEGLETAPDVDDVFRLLLPPLVLVVLDSTSNCFLACSCSDNPDFFRSVSAFSTSCGAVT